MKNLLIILVLLYCSNTICQEINSYQEYLKYKEKNTKKIIELQEKENQTESDRYSIIEYFNESSTILENLLTKYSTHRSDIILELIDNYTYCMRKYPYKTDTIRILHYFDKAKSMGLCDYSYHNYLVELRNDNVFQLIKNDPCVTKVLCRYDSEINLWYNNNFKTEFKTNISDKEKIAGLSKFWSEAKFNFAYFDHVPHLNWDSLYIAFIPKVLSTNSTKSFYDTLKIFCAKLNDSHTNVNYPNELNIGRAPIRCKMIENRVFISEVLNDSLKRIGLTRGLEVLKINHIPIIDYANKNIRLYISSSTEQDLLVRTYEYFLSEGDKDEELYIELIDNFNKKYEYTISRKLPYNLPWSNSNTLEFKILEDNIGYLALNSFSSNSKVKNEFNNVFDQISKTDGLIIDIRNNGGGNSSNGDYIFSCFIDKPAYRWHSATRNYRPAERAWNILSSWDKTNNVIEPNEVRNYSKPIVILTSAKTFSAAEDFCILFDINKRAEIIGQPTGGSTGQPLSFDLPGGGNARVCTKRSNYPDGKEFVGYGIQPNIYIKETVSDFLEARDIVLENAHGYMKNKINE